MLEIRKIFHYITKAYFIDHVQHHIILYHKDSFLLLLLDVEVDADSYTLMTVDISLTELGLSHVSDVIATVMQYVPIIIANADDLQRNWNDFVNVQSINFKYAPKDDADSFVS